MKNKIITFILVAWVMLSFCYIAGEPIEPMSLGKFMLCKLLGFISLGASAFAIWSAERNGIITFDEVNDTEI